MNHQKWNQMDQGSPLDLRTNYSFLFISSSIDKSQKILEVGCGDGELAERLASAGHFVTALDPSLEDADRVSKLGVHYIERDLENFDGGPFDAVIFNASLHHVSPLDVALKHTDSLLGPEGLLILDEADLVAPDEQTAAWFYDHIDRLLDERLITEMHEHDHAEDQERGERSDPPLLRWQKDHQHDPPLHTGDQMLLEVERRFALLRTSRGPYLFRYVAQLIEQTDRGLGEVQNMLKEETELIASAKLKSVGLRVVARKS